MILLNRLAPAAPRRARMVVPVDTFTSLPARSGRFKEGAAAIVGAPCSVGGAASALNDSRKTFSVPSIEGLAESGLRGIPALL